MSLTSSKRILRPTEPAQEWTTPRMAAQPLHKAPLQSLSASACTTRPTEIWLISNATLLAHLARKRFLECKVPRCIRAGFRLRSVSNSSKSARAILKAAAGLTTKVSGRLKRIRCRLKGVISLCAAWQRKNSPLSLVARTRLVCWVVEIDSICRPKSGSSCPRWMLRERRQAHAPSMEMSTSSVGRIKIAFSTQLKSWAMLEGSVTKSLGGGWSTWLRTWWSHASIQVWACLISRKSWLWADWPTSMTWWASSATSFSSILSLNLSTSACRTSQGSLSSRLRVISAHNTKRTRSFASRRTTTRKRTKSHLLLSTRRELRWSERSSSFESHRQAYDYSFTTNKEIQNFRSKLTNHSPVLF